MRPAWDMFRRLDEAADPWPIAAPRIPNTAVVSGLPFSSLQAARRNLMQGSSQVTTQPTQPGPSGG